MYKFKNTAIRHSSVTVMATQNLDLIDRRESGIPNLVQKEQQKQTAADLPTPIYSYKN